MKITALDGVRIATRQPLPFLVEWTCDCGEEISCDLADGEGVAHDVEWNAPGSFRLFASCPKCDREFDIRGTLRMTLDLDPMETDEVVGHRIDEHGSRWEIIKLMEGEARRRQLKRQVADHAARHYQYPNKDGCVLVDVQTAHQMLAFMEALKPEKTAKWLAMDIEWFLATYTGLLEKLAGG